jgi:hypothetical protein
MESTGLFKKMSFFSKLIKAADYRLIRGQAHIFGSRPSDPRPLEECAPLWHSNREKELPI